MIKLLAVVENTDAGVSARVYPALISNTHPLASVHGSFNAVFVKAEAADDLMFYGRGAGGAPTASAVVGDVVTEARHIAQGCNVSMYKTNIQCESAGVFKGPMVVSMRPMTPENAQKAKEITDRYPNVHGGPVQIGDPAAIGIKDISKPDIEKCVADDTLGEKTYEKAECKMLTYVIKQAIENAKLPLVITHAPGHMFITNVLNTELNDYLEAKKQK